MIRVLIGIALLLAGACSKSEASEAIHEAAAVERPTSETAIDMAVSDLIRAAILHDSNLRSDAGTVRVQTIQGRVILSGSVSNEQQGQRVEVLVDALGGALRVDNRLDVDSGSSTTQDRLVATLDGAISNQVQSALFDDPSIMHEVMGIHVSTQEGVVTLSGSVRGALARERARVIAESVGSVIRVENQISVGRGV